MFVLRLFVTSPKRTTSLPRPNKGLQPLVVRAETSASFWISTSSRHLTKNESRRATTLSGEPDGDRLEQASSRPTQTALGQNRAAAAFECRPHPAAARAARLYHFRHFAGVQRGFDEFVHLQGLRAAAGLQRRQQLRVDVHQAHPQRLFRTRPAQHRADSRHFVVRANTAGAGVRAAHL